MQEHFSMCVRACAPAHSRTIQGLRQAAPASPIGQGFASAQGIEWCGVHAHMCRISFGAKVRSVCKTCAMRNRFVKFVFFTAKGNLDGSSVAASQNILRKLVPIFCSSSVQRMGTQNTLANLVRYCW